MPRQPRYPLPDIPQHIMQRGHNRPPAFFTGEDYRFYLTCLQHVAEQDVCAVHAYVLMTHHVHCWSPHRKLMASPS